MWMNDVAAAWLMTSLAPTPLWVALVQSASTLPVFLLGLSQPAVFAAIVFLVVVALGWLVLNRTRYGRYVIDDARSSKN
jgi:ribose/xylose/arabinose/galactoside ABC-type transport system permease subunit